MSSVRCILWCFFFKQKTAYEMRISDWSSDVCSSDLFCDHRLVFDEERGSGAEAVVGTYRVMRREGAAARGQFYTSNEYEIDSLTSYPGEILELGRPCVEPTYRSGATRQLLWRGIAEHVFTCDIPIMIGCTSRPATDPPQIRLTPETGRATRRER